MCISRAISLRCTWKGQNADSIATFISTASENFASASQVANIVDKNGNVKEASIVAAVNNNASSISLSADSITFSGQKLDIKVDAANIEGTLTIGQLPSTVAEDDDIPTKTSDLINDSEFQNASGVVTLAKGAITADYIKTLELEVGNQIKMGTDAKISWDSVTGKDNVASKADVSTAKNEAIDVASKDATDKASNAKSGAISEIESKGYQNANQVTQITKDTITTTYIRGLNLEVGNEIKMGSNAQISWNNVTDKDSVATTDQVKTEIGNSKIKTSQIEVTDLNAFDATIGGWNIDGDGIHTDCVGMLSSNDSYSSLVDSESKSPARFFAGNRERGEATIVLYPIVEEVGLSMSYWMFTGSYDVPYKDGCIKSPVAVSAILRDLRLEGTIELDTTGTTGNVRVYFDVDDVEGRIFVELDYHHGTPVNFARTEVSVKIKYDYMYGTDRSNSKFMVLEDGSLYASAANIGGIISAEKGSIGDWNIDHGSMFGGDKESEYIELSPSVGFTVQSLGTSMTEIGYPGVTITKENGVINISLPKNCIAMANPYDLGIYVYNDANQEEYELGWESGANNKNILESSIGGNIDINKLDVTFFNASFFQKYVEYKQSVSITPNGIAQFKEIRADKYYDTQGTLLFEVIRDGLDSEDIYFKAIMGPDANKKTVIELIPYSDSNYSTPSKASFSVIYMDCWSEILGQTLYEMLTFNLTGSSSAKATSKYLPTKLAIRFFNNGEQVSCDLMLDTSDTSNGCKFYSGKCGTRVYESDEKTKLKFHVPCEFPS